MTDLYQVWLTKEEATELAIGTPCGPSDQFQTAQFNSAIDKLYAALAAGPTSPEQEAQKWIVVQRGITTQDFNPAEEGAAE